MNLKICKRSTEVVELFFELIDEQFGTIDDEESLDSFMLALELIVALSIQEKVGYPYKKHADYLNMRVKKILDMYKEVNETKKSMNKIDWKSQREKILHDHN